MSIKKPSELNIDILNQRSKDLYNEFLSDVAINEINLKEKGLSVAAIKGKWLNCLQAEKKFLEKLEEKRNKMLENYVQNHGQQGKPKFVTEREALANEQIKKIEENIYDEKEVIRTIENLLESIKDLTYQIKNCIELIKLENN